MSIQTCCFTGHRHLPADKIEDIKKRLNDELDRLYHQGVRRFISGGAIGFDRMDAAAVAEKHGQGWDLQLISALPCENQSERWTDTQRQNYQHLLDKANEIIYISKEFTPDCMKKRNFYMVDNSQVCICAYLFEKSGAGQTLRYAKQKGLEIINIALTNPKNQNFQ